MPVGSGFYVKEGMISNELINVDTDKDGKFDHFYFSIWNQKLHAKQPLGNMRKLVLSIDKETIEAERIFFVIRDQWICVEQMPTIKDIWLMLKEEAHIYVKQDGGIEPGIHNVDITIENQILMYTRHIDSKDIRPRVTLNLQAKMNTT